MRRIAIDCGECDDYLECINTGQGTKTMNNDGRKRIDAMMKDIEAQASAKTEIDALIEELNGKIRDRKSVV